jgi:hypothetical protein
MLRDGRSSRAPPRPSMRTPAQSGKQETSRAAQSWRATRRYSGCRALVPTARRRRCQRLRATAILLSSILLSHRVPLARWGHRLPKTRRSGHGAMVPTARRRRCRRLRASTILPSSILLSHRVPLARWGHRLPKTRRSGRGYRPPTARRPELRPRRRRLRHDNLPQRPARRFLFRQATRVCRARWSAKSVRSRKRGGMRPRAPRRRPARPLPDLLRRRRRQSMRQSRPLTHRSPAQCRRLPPIRSRRRPVRRARAPRLRGYNTTLHQRRSPARSQVVRGALCVGSHQGRSVSEPCAGGRRHRCGCKALHPAGRRPEPVPRAFSVDVGLGGRGGAKSRAGEAAGKAVCAGFATAVYPIRHGIPSSIRISASNDTASHTTEPKRLRRRIMCCTQSTKASGLFVCGMPCCTVARGTWYPTRHGSSPGMVSPRHAGFYGDSGAGSAAGRSAAAHAVSESCNGPCRATKHTVEHSGAQ